METKTTNSEREVLYQLEAKYRDVQHNQILDSRSLNKANLCPAALEKQCKYINK